MTAEQLRIIRQAVPFRPFTIHLADGRMLPVPHRDFISQSQGGRTIIVYGAGEEFNIVDLYLVTDLEIHSPADSESGNSPK